MRFSVIIPVYNARPDHFDDCLGSVVRQAFPADRFEIILVDDCSTDTGWQQTPTLASDSNRVRLERTPVNGGPGMARNVGIATARGEWLVFIDSDDTLQPEALHTLDQAITDDIDAIGYDWRWQDDAEGGGRRDGSFIEHGRDAIAQRYLRLQMDGSVIYTAVRRRLVLDNGLKFEPGFHEDVDFIFEIYWLARRIALLPEVLYRKRQRLGSIVNSISPRHIEGFTRAWVAIAGFLQQRREANWLAWRDAYQAGMVAVVATRLREIRRHARLGPEAGELFAALHEAWRRMVRIAGAPTLEGNHTKYYKLTTGFLSLMERDDMSESDRTAAIIADVDDITARSWSCVDLHHSVFLAPGEVRTCCKRFFVDGEMRGDVVLFQSAKSTDEVSLTRITEAKKDLYVAINKGESTACDGCPFLEFKQWGDLAPLRINYLSMEHHSVCNLVCTYCSDTYYGGAQASYDVAHLVDDMLENHVIVPSPTVVWGGGEPAVGKDFNKVITKLADRLPDATQRVLTNSVKHSPTVERLLANRNIVITTSIDAGNKGTFARIRGKDRLAKVIRNLQTYSSVSPDLVTIKYIFTEGNSAFEEVRGFLDLMKDANLLGCNYQISSDFKQEEVPDDSLVNMVAMYSMLLHAGCRLVFFDDLLRHRLLGMGDEATAALIGNLEALKVEPAIALSRDYPNVAVWGAGWQAKYMFEKSTFFKKSRIAFFADSTPSKLGTEFLGAPVRDPSALLESDVPVLIAAVQGYPKIYSQFIAMGLPIERLVRGLII